MTLHHVVWSNSTRAGDGDCHASVLVEIVFTDACDPNLGGRGSIITQHK